MRRDSLKTFGAIVLILIIVGVTFWYGNRQRQAQVKGDQQSAQQQAKKPATNTTQVVKPTSTPVAKANPEPTPVAKSSAAPTPAPAVTTPAPAATPQTGGSLEIILPLAALAVAFRVKRSSVQMLKRAHATV